MKIRNWAAAGFLSLTAFGLSAQQAAQASRATGSAPSLAETMQTIQSELNQVGRLNFVIHIEDREEGNATVQYSTEVSNAVADPASCTIRYHWKRSMRGEVVNDEDVSISLGDILGLSMMTVEQHEKAVFERERASPDEQKKGHMEFDPPMFMVVARKAGGNEEGFAFIDEKMAGRVAKALGRGVELCGGKNIPY
jgi:hypothetical protein